jgi:hypothetical protein
MTIYRSYDKDEFLKEFTQTEIYKKLTQQYRYMFSDKHDIDIDVGDVSQGEECHRSTLENASICLYSQFYYLGLIQENNPEVIADVGCGRNLIKKYIPNVVGFDKTHFADHYEWFDEKFIDNHYQEFNSAFSVNAIHFVSLIEFANRINDFGKIIKPNGLGFVTFNLLRMIEHTKPHEFAKIFDLSRPVTSIDYRLYIEKQLKNVTYNLLLVDITFEDQIKKNYEIIRGIDWPTYEDYVVDNFTNITDDIIKEIKNFNFTDHYFNNDLKSDAYNGNIRIVFKV